MAWPTAFVDMGACDKALEEFDGVMQHTLTNGNIYAIVDSASLLWRLEVRAISCMDSYVYPSMICILISL